MNASDTSTSSSCRSSVIEKSCSKTSTSTSTVTRSPTTRSAFFTQAIEAMRWTPTLRIPHRRAHLQHRHGRVHLALGESPCARPVHNTWCRTGIAVGRLTTVSFGNRFHERLRMSSCAKRYRGSRPDRLRDEQLRALGLLDRVQHDIGITAAFDRLEDAQAETRPRSRRSSAPARRLGQAAAVCCPITSRTPSVLRRPHFQVFSPGPVFVEQLVFLGKMLKDLFDKERIPLGVVEDYPGERRRRHVAAERRQHGFDPLNRQSPQYNARDTPFAQQRLERARERPRHPQAPRRDTCDGKSGIDLCAATRCCMSMSVGSSAQCRSSRTTAIGATRQDRSTNARYALKRNRRC